MVIQCAVLALAMSLPLPAGAPEALDRATPRGAWEHFRKAVAEDDGEGIWSFLALESRRALISDSDGSMARLRGTPDAALQEMADAAGVTPAEMKTAAAEDLAPLVMKAEARKNKTRILKSLWKGVVETGDTAVMTVTLPGGAEECSVLVREAGTWRLDGPATKRARQQVPSPRTRSD